MTVDEVRKALSLMDFDEYVNYSHALNDERMKELYTPEILEREQHRRTGRTTRLLCEALAAMSEGKSVHLAGRNFHHTKDLYRKLAVLAAQLGLRTRLGEDVRFVDHG